LNLTVIITIISCATFSLVCGIYLAVYVILRALLDTVSRNEEQEADGFLSGWRTADPFGVQKQTVQGQVIPDETVSGEVARIADYPRT
jgi:hypothetical protein